MSEISGIVYLISVWVLPLIFAITLHEAAHAWVAEKLGDDTARRLGRVTFNPLRHIDRVGTLILPGILLLLRAPFIFGYAKPVPVNFARLRNPKRDMVLVALAGPGMNIGLAFACAWLIYLTPHFSPWLGRWIFENLFHGIVINVILAVFNMLPLPPLDGGRVLTGLLPVRLAVRFARLERFGILILLGVLFLLPLVGQQLGVDLNVFVWFMQPALYFVFEIMSYATGLDLTELL